VRRIRDALSARRLIRVLRDDRGSVTAEFAITLPIVGAVIALCVVSVGLSAQQLRLNSIAAEIARSEARGDSQTGRLLGGIEYPVSVHRSHQGDVQCVHLSANPAGGGLSAVTISARSCAFVSVVR
jgi:hypothetical protein